MPEVRLVDPRDITVEEAEPTYRCSFCGLGPVRPGDYDITGVDSVEEVIAWADAKVEPDETYVLGVRCEISDI